MRSPKSVLVSGSAASLVSVLPLSSELLDPEDDEPPDEEPSSEEPHPVRTTRDIATSAHTRAKVSVVTVEGLRILGDRDPNRTQIGGGTTPVSEETPAETGARLAETACEGDDVDLLLIYTPRVGDAAMRTGCAAVRLR